jgi:hypothetical protein
MKISTGKITEERILGNVAVDLELIRNAPRPVPPSVAVHIAARQ